MFRPRNPCAGAVVFLVVVGFWASGCDNGKTSQQSRAPSNVPASPLPPPPPPPSTALATVWEPDPAILDNLGTYQDIKGYEVRPPKGWSLAPGINYSSAKRVLYDWHGPKRDDGSSPELCISWTVMPPAQNEVASGLGAVFDEFSEAVGEESKIPGQTTDKQSGQISGVRFVRGNITKRSDSGEVTLHLLYVSRDGPSLIMMRFTDVRSHFAESAKLGTAAILTFRKKP